MISKEIQDKMPQIIACLKVHGVVEAYLFGSAAHDALRVDSDVDFLVTFDAALSPVQRGRALVALHEEVENIVKRSVDILQEKSLRNIYFIEAIEPEKRLIYGKEHTKISA